MLREAQGSLCQSHRHFEFEIIDAQSIPSNDETFHAVIANHVLYHVADRPRALSEIRRVLKPGGCLYAATNGQGHLRELRELVMRVKPDVYLDTGTDRFGLDNGSEQLSRWFSKIDVHHRQGRLAVTEVDALVAYVQSTRRLDQGQLAEFEKLAEKEIALHGVVQIGTDAGMFEAHKDALDSTPSPQVSIDQRRGKRNERPGAAPVHHDDP